jgi:hypothetical protein
MSRSWPLFVALSTVTMAACNPFHHADPVQVSTKDAALNTRWHANLASPADLAGAVQMNGSASMAPAGSRGTTTVLLDLANATPGGQHPWALHRGQCGSDQGLIGSAGAYPVAEVGRDGHATSSATLPIESPTSGNYFVTVAASAANESVVVACGNLAPPTL